MKRGRKIIIIVLCVCIACGAIVGGLIAARNGSRKPVGVFAVTDISMTDYWGDTS